MTYFRILQRLNIILSLLISNKAFSQEPSFKNYSIEQGLSNTTVYAAIQDSKGFMWFGTETGLCQFDGLHFKTFSTPEGLTDNTVLKLYIDNSGKLWLVTLSGKVFYLENNTIKPFSFPNEYDRIVIKDLTSDRKNNIWMASSNYGLIRCNGKEIKSVSIPSQSKDLQYIPVALTKNSKNQIWLLCSSGLVKIEDSKLTSYDFPDHINKGAEGTIELNKNGSLYYLRTGKLYNFNSSTKIHSKISGLEGKSAYSINFDQDQNIWISTSQGLAYFDSQTKFGGFYLKHKIITSTVSDTENNLWVCTLNDGAFFTPSKYILNYNNTEFTDDKITRIAKDKRNTIWIGTEKGNVFYREKNNWVNVSIPQSTSNKNRLSSFHIFGDTLIAANNEMLFKLSLLTKKILFSKSLPNKSSIKCLSVGKNGDVYIGTHNGLFIQKRDSFHTTEVKGRITALQIDTDGLIWLCNNGELVNYKDGVSKPWGSLNPTLKTRSYSMALSPNNSLWIATQGSGLVRVKNETIEVINESHGLISNICSSVFVDKNSIVWVSSNKGLCKIELANDRITKIQSYTTKNGLPSKKINEVYVVNDTVWVASNYGVTYFDNRKIKLNQNPPPVYITRVKILNKDTLYAPKYELAFHQNNISIEFIGLAYKNSSEMRYKYKMLGLDKNWNYTSLNTVQYPNLPAGEYIFEVAASNEDGYWSSTPASVRFTILPAWWQTTWFKLITILLSLSLIITFFRIRIRTIRKREEEKTLLNKKIAQLELSALRAQMNPHFIFNCLNSIQNLINKGDEDNANLYLNKFADLLRMILENSRNEKITLSTELEALQLYVDMEMLRFDSKIDFKMHYPTEQNIDSIKLPPLLLQPFVENSIKHGLLTKQGYRKVELFLSTDDKYLTCVIEDNGVGRIANETVPDLGSRKKSSLGLQITQDRISALYKTNNEDLTFVVTDLTDENKNPSGTRVSIKIPL